MKVSERERLAIRGVLRAMSASDIAVDDEESAWEALSLAARMLGYVLGEEMTEKKLRKKMAVMLKDEPEFQQAFNEAFH